MECETHEDNLGSRHYRLGSKKSVRHVISPIAAIASKQMVGDSCRVELFVHTDDIGGLAKVGDTPDVLISYTAYRDVVVVQYKLENDAELYSFLRDLDKIVSRWAGGTPGLFAVGILCGEFTESAFEGEIGTAMLKILERENAKFDEWWRATAVADRFAVPPPRPILPRIESAVTQSCGNENDETVIVLGQFVSRAALGHTVLPLQFFAFFLGFGPDRVGTWKDADMVIHITRRLSRRASMEEIAAVLDHSFPDRPIRFDIRAYLAFFMTSVLELVVDEQRFCEETLDPRPVFKKLFEALRAPENRQIFIHHVYSDDSTENPTPADRRRYAALIEKGLAPPTLELAPVRMTAAEFLEALKPENIGKYRASACVAAQLGENEYDVVPFREFAERALGTEKMVARIYRAM